MNYLEQIWDNTILIHSLPLPFPIYFKKNIHHICWSSSVIIICPRFIRNVLLFCSAPHLSTSESLCPPPTSESAAAPAYSPPYQTVTRFGPGPGWTHGRVPHAWVTFGLGRSLAAGEVESATEAGPCCCRRRWSAAGGGCCCQGAVHGSDGPASTAIARR
jgi:hypothetical protein